MPTAWFLSGNSVGACMIPGLRHGESDETYRLISTPAFLLSLQGIRSPSKPSALSSLPVNHAEPYYDRVLPLLRFLTLVTQQQPNPRGGEEKASLTRCCCCFHLSPPAPQFPLTLHQATPPPSYNYLQLQLISVSCDVIQQC